MVMPAAVKDSTLLTLSWIKVSSLASKWRRSMLRDNLLYNMREKTSASPEYNLIRPRPPCKTFRRASQSTHRWRHNLHTTGHRSDRICA